MFIHERICTDQWEQIPVDSLDIVAIRIKGEDSNLNIYNIYNACEHSGTILKLCQHLHQQETQFEETQQCHNPQGMTENDGDLWLGDFNRHHPMWDKAEDSRLFTQAAITNAGILLNLPADYSMEMALPKGIPTIRNSAGNETQPDNVFCSNTITSNITVCKVLPEEQPDPSDHYPIYTEVVMPVTHHENMKPQDFRDIDWKKFQDALQEKLSNIPLPTLLTSPSAIDQALEELKGTIIATIEQLVPRKHPTPYSKRWWTKELTQAHIQARNLASKANKYKNAPDLAIHEEAC